MHDTYNGNKVFFSSSFFFIYVLFYVIYFAHILKQIFFTKGAM